jgi:ribonuclease HII
VPPRGKKDGPPAARGRSAPPAGGLFAGLGREKAAAAPVSGAPPAPVAGDSGSGRASGPSRADGVSGPAADPGAAGKRLSGLLSFDLAYGEPLAGLDEAGRGPLAGPLVAAAVVLDPAVAYPGVDDSKRLSPKERERAAAMIRERALCWALAERSPAEVDALNPLRASMEAMAEAFSALRFRPLLALADGNVRPPITSARVEAVVRGDSRSLAVAAASILAKTARDAEMERLHALYPRYGFDRNKGYGTREHLEALARHGPSPVHRLSYKGVAGPPGRPGGLF